MKTMAESKGREEKKRGKFSLRILLIRLGSPRTDRFKADVNGLITVRRQVLKSPPRAHMFSSPAVNFHPKVFPFSDKTRDLPSREPLSTPREPSPRLELS